jgi:hypothetical protein
MAKGEGARVIGAVVGVDYRSHSGFISAVENDVFHECAVMDFMTGNVFLIADTATIGTKLACMDEALRTWARDLSLVEAAVRQAPESGEKMRLGRYTARRGMYDCKPCVEIETADEFFLSWSKGTPGESLKIFRERMQFLSEAFEPIEAVGLALNNRTRSDYSGHLVCAEDDSGEPSGRALFVGGRFAWWQEPVELSESATVICLGAGH